MSCVCSATSASPAHPEPAWPSGAAAAAGHAPRCRRTGAGRAGRPGPAGNSAPWLRPESTVPGSALTPHFLPPPWRSWRGGRGVREAASPTGPAQPTDSDPPSQTGSPLRPGHMENRRFIGGYVSFKQFPALLVMFLYHSVVKQCRYVSAPRSQTNSWTLKGPEPPPPRSCRFSPDWKTCLQLPHHCCLPLPAATLSERGRPPVLVPTAPTGDTGVPPPSPGLRGDTQRRALYLKTEETTRHAVNDTASIMNAPRT